MVGLKFPKIAGAEDGSVASEEFPQGAAHTDTQCHTILRSVGNHIQDFSLPMSRELFLQIA